MWTAKPGWGFERGVGGIELWGTSPSTPLHAVSRLYPSHSLEWWTEPLVGQNSLVLLALRAQGQARASWAPPGRVLMGSLHESLRLRPLTCRRERTMMLPSQDLEKDCVAA